MLVIKVYGQNHVNEVTTLLNTDYVIHKEAGSLLELASRLISFRTTTAPAVNACIDYCAGWLRNAGLKPSVYEQQGLKSVVVSAGQGSPVIVLNGHVDVVPGAPDQFVPRIEGGRLYGRGSYDMLGSVAVMMELMAELAANPPECTVVLALVPDEESGGEYGTGHLVSQGIVGDIAICGEPTNLDIAVQAKGILQLVIEAKGVAAHGSRPWLGKNAILQALEHYRAIARMEAFKQSSVHFASPSLNLAKIRAGEVFNQVPDVCKLGVDIRYLPEQCPDKLLADIREAIPEAVVHVHFEGSPVNTSEGHAMVRRLQKVAGGRYFGQDGSADTRFYAAAGMPAVEFGPAGADHHGPGEYVDILSLVKYKHILKAFITGEKGVEHAIQG